MDTLEGTLLKGYKLEERIGNGGFGAVYRATQTTIEREVAIKFILPGYANNPDFIRRFEAEAQLIARLEHPHITPLIDYWRDPDGAYLVMRYLRGGSVRQSLQNEAFELYSLSQMLDQLASALDFAHRNGVVHRDIKPGNILLDEDGNTYLADFGIAKDLTNLTRDKTGTNIVVGSLDYISPEQARSEPVTPRTDIYSLGVTLYEMITGEHPFKDSSSIERLYKHINDPLPEIVSLPDTVRNTINHIIQKATAKNPDHRYADVMALAMAFREGVGRGSITHEATIIEQLTMREQEILALIANGKSNAEIAGQLVVTMSTVKWHITQLYKKLGVRSRVQAIVRARELSLIVTNGAKFLVPYDGTPSSEISLPEPENPYKGLYAFQTSDSQDFFGRDELISKLLERMQNTQDGFHHFLAIVGPSGSGKSSLVKAGLIPALWNGALVNSEKWFVVDMIPGTHPIDKLETALIRVAANQAHNLREQLQRDERGLLRVADIILPGDDTQLVIVIDQFEEVFTLVEDEDKRQHFLDLLRTAVSDSRSRVRIIVTLRADYYDRPLHYPEFGELIRNRMETILPLSAKGLERAIRGPAERVGVIFEQGLVEQIVSQMNYQAGALPLLQYALTELFDRRNGRVLTNEAYQQIGGAVGALANRADEIYHSLAPEAQELAHQMFLRLVTLGEGAEDARRRAPHSELVSLTDNTDLMEEIIDQFAAYRLLSLDHDPQTRQPTVEVAHEAILREWERLRMWLNESREEIRLQQQLSYAAKEWFDSNKDASFLLRGTRLNLLGNWASETSLILTDKEATFLKESVKDRTRREQEEEARQAREFAQEQRSRTLVRALLVVFAVAAILSAGFGVFAFIQRNSAVVALDVAQRSGLAFAANSALRTDDVDLALALAMESVGNNKAEMLPETQAVIENLADAEGPRLLLDENILNANMCNMEFSDSYAYWLVANCDKGTWSVFDPLANKVIATGPKPANYKFGAKFSPDNKFILIQASDWLGETTQVEVWKVDDLSLVSSFEIDNPIVDLRWTGDSSMIGTIDILPENIPQARDQYIQIGDTVSLWNAKTGELVRRLKIDAPYYHSLNFSHDGKMGIVGGWSSFDADKQYQVTIFDTQTGATLYQFERPALHQPDGNPIGAFDLGFSPDDKVIRFSGYPSYAIDLATGENYGHVNELNTSSIVLITPDMNYAFSPDVNDLRWFNLQTGEQMRFPNFKFILPTTASDKLVVNFIGHSDFYLWDMHGRNDAVATLNAGQGTFTFAAFSPDGQYIGVVTGNFGQTSNTVTVIYHADTFKEAYRLDTDTNLPFDLAWSPDSRSFATVTDSQGVILWDAQTGQETRRFTYGDKPTPVAQVEFTPDGRYLVSGRHSRYYPSEGQPFLLVWDVESGALIKRIELPSSVSPNFGVHWITMHPTQNLVYVTVNENVYTGGSFDGIAPDQMGSYLVNLDTGAVEKIKKDFLPYAAAFTPDGRELIFSAFNDNYIRVYDVKTRSLTRKWQSNQAGISGIAISPDGQSLLTNSSLLDASPVIDEWDIKTGQLIRRYSDNSQQSFFIGADFSPSGDRFVSAVFDGTARVWNFSRQTALDWIHENRYIRELSCPERQIYRVEPLCDQ
jgi:serine/threonine protein kinase/WD40 repeat protein/energy-coupling factor transporter ATP-binding protein EcfA2